ncbi:MarR family winged helix-turn-helix transcriptional regulator [Rossellomorea vietnamensis]|uniref:MarR family winged helix-turn-helix transcriptional regulator n=1 Tax=Rossellomorea vietnamensis TaxID=218284 RepID=UPI001E2C7358|nr:MarR family transcriptional regulator [Rossellomorea vietnamensis]
MLLNDFNLKNLPSSQTLMTYSEKFPEVDVEGVLMTLEFLSTAKEVNSAYGKYFLKQGLSEGKFTLLMLLYRHPENPITPSELARSASVTKATITGLIDGLSKDGLVRRSIHPDDRRKQVVLLTNQGINVLEKMLPDHYRKTAKLVNRLSTEERSVFLQLLSKVREGISDFNEE